MPVVSEEEAADSGKRRQRGARALYLLFVPPVLLLGLLVGSTFRPVELQLGPAMLLVVSAPTHGGPYFIAGGNAILTGTPVMWEDRHYTVTGSGWGGGVSLPGRAFGIGWFPGHRK